MTPHRIALITDSTCDIPAEWREQYDLTVIPLTIVFGDQEYLDGVDISPEEFYNRLTTERPLPTTSQPSPRRFLEAYQAAAAKGAQEIIVFVISSAMSGTIQSARQAAEQMSIPVHIVDGKNNSMGLGWQVIAAAREREAGGTVESILKIAGQVRDTMVYYITLNTMEYLAKGGRIGGATKFLETLLRIKPLICVNPISGSVQPSIPARSRQGAINGLMKEFFSHIDTQAPMHITVLHNAALDEAKELAERVQREYSPAEMFISIVSPVLGVHTGPKALALCGYSLSQR